VCIQFYVGSTHSIFSIHTTLYQRIIIWCLIFQFFIQHHTNVPTSIHHQEQMILMKNDSIHDSFHWFCDLIHSKHKVWNLKYHDLKKFVVLWFDSHMIWINLFKFLIYEGLNGFTIFMIQLTSRKTSYKCEILFLTKVFIKIIFQPKFYASKPW